MLHPQPLSYIYTQTHTHAHNHLPPSLQTSLVPEEWVLHPQPLSYNYDEFERLLLGIAYHIYVTKKKGEAFEEVRGVEAYDS